MLSSPISSSTSTSTSTLPPIIEQLMAKSLSPSSASILSLIRLNCQKWWLFNQIGKWKNFKFFNNFQSSSTSSSLTILTYSIVAIISIVCFINSLNGDFVHDDIPAIVKNGDVHGTTTIWQLFNNDFWGRPMSDVESHKSYRPITTFTFSSSNSSSRLSSESINM
ncbi:hypothetical protein DERF_015822 [Dermatophagoides farinae]|uniref:Uncharacterized protein n=1 Tax=Dermatophagoides farinae TaxID=6954 RepID=A0A922HFA0_DERFA|nr:hypothetical protein DERF_015822 [Dermatophagoides farinae]